jgi:hypothetical protein
MLQVLAQYDVEVAGSGDQKVVEALSSQCPDEPFRDRVRPGRSDRGADDPQVGAGEDGVERGGKLAVPVADQEPEPIAAIAEIHQQVAGLLGHPGTGRVGGDPRDVRTATLVLDHDEDVEAAQEQVSTWAKSTARIAWACADRNCRQVGPDRRGAGSSPASFKIFQTVEAATGWPSPTNSPWIRR